MGATRNTGYLENIIAYDNSDNVAITGAVNVLYKVTLGGNTLVSGTLNVSSSVTASSFIKSGGTASQILAADGTVITAGTNITISGGTISAGDVGFANPMTTLGDTMYGGASGAATRLAGNTTATKQYLSQTGNGTTSAAPSWATITGSDITGAALTKSDDTNVTLTLGGTPATALLRAASLTLGWTGQLAISRGGTGASTKAAAFDALSPMTTLGDIIYGGASGTGTRLAGSTSASKRFLIQTGDGTNSAAPSWGAIAAADVPTLNQNTTGSAATLTTARTLTIGATGKTFDGSANVSWSLAEIGAQAALTDPVTGTGNTNRIAKFTSNGSAIGNANMFDDGVSVVVNHTNKFNIFTTETVQYNLLQVATTNSLGLGVAMFANTIAGGYLIFNKSRSATIGSHVAVDNGDYLGNILFRGSDGTNYIDAGLIGAIVDASVGTNNVKSRLIFQTGIGTGMATRLQISNTGNIRFNAYTTNGILKVSGSAGDVELAVAGTDYQTPLTNPVTGTGTQHYIAKFTATGSAIGDSTITNNGRLTSFESNQNNGTEFKIKNTTAGTVAQPYITLEGESTARFFNMGKVSSTFNPPAWLGAGDGYLYNGTGNISIYNADGRIKMMSDGVTSSEFRISSSVPISVGNNTTSGGRYEFYRNSTPTQAGSIGNGFSGTISDDVVIATYNTTTSWTRRMTILNNTSGTPRVSIGGTSPDVGLTIEGSTIADTAIGLKNTSVDGGSWYIYSTGTGYAQGNKKLLFYRAGDGNGGAMVLDWDGRLGIGTMTPSSLLTVAGTSDLAWSASTSKLQISRSGTVARLQNYETGVASNISLQWDGGNVGVGISTPLSVLHISGLSGTTGLPSLLLYGESSATGQRYGFNVSNDQLDVSALGANARIAFFTGGNASTATSQERMRITSGGNVIAGPDGASTTARLTSYLGSTALVANTNNDGIRMQVESYNDGARNTIAWGQNGSNLTLARFGLTWNGGASQMCFVWRDMYNSAAGSTEIMRLTGGGRLGIGTDPGYTLDVNGDTQIRGDLIFTKGSRSTIYPSASNQNLHMKSNGTGVLQFNDDVTGNIVMVNGGGKVGVGTSPSAKLEVFHNGGNGGAGASDYGIFTVADTNNNNQATIGAFHNAGGYANINLGDVSSGTRRFWHISKRLSSSNDQGAGARSLTFYWNNGTDFTAAISVSTGGNVYAAGGYFETSDIRLKTVLERNPTVKLDVDVIKFTKHGQEGIRYGYSAQEVQAIAPELVTDGEYLQLNYTDVHTLKIAALEKEIKELKEQLKNK